MIRWSKVVVQFIVLMIPFAATDIMSQTHRANKLICGFNVRTGMNAYRYWTVLGHQLKIKLSQMDQNTIVEIVNACGLYSTEMSRQLGLHPLPIVWLTRGGENAFVTDVEWIRSSRQSQIYADDDWIRQLVAQTGSAWTRTAVLAHELGHVYYGHTYGRGSSTTWQREYDADFFNGYALGRMGASLEDAQAVYYIIAPEASEENASSHPSLRYRLQAVREGWERAGNR